MRKLNLVNYTVTQQVINTSDPAAEPQVIAQSYNVKDSVVALMFIPELKLSGVELLKQNILAMKIETCENDAILLEETEWERLVKSVNTFKGFTRNDVELVNRILNTEIIDINERN